MAIDTNTFLADMKIVYGAIRDQVSSEAAFMNLLGDGSKFGQPINNLGVRGYVFLARLGPNWNLGYRPEGTVGVGSAGNQNLQNATVILKYMYCPELITGQAENLSKGNARAFMQAKALEVKFDMKDIVSHQNVVCVGADRGGQLAVVSASSPGSLTTTAVGTAGPGAGALYLRVGQIIDTGPSGGGALSVVGATITAINYSTGVVTHTGGTATVGHGVFLTGECPTTTAQWPLTSEGLVSLISNTGAIEGLNPATQGQQAWQSYSSDNGGNQITSQFIQQLCQYTRARGGEQVDYFYFPMAQVNQLVSIATSTVQFHIRQDAKTDAGKKAFDFGFRVFSYAGMDIIEDKDARPDRIYALANDACYKFEAVPLSMAEDEAGTWTRVSGTNGIADAVQGLMRNYINIGAMQRSAAGIGIDLSIPTQFQTQPATL